MEDIKNIIKAILNEQTTRITLEKFKKLLGLSPEFSKYVSYLYRFIKNKGYSFDELEEKDMQKRLVLWAKYLKWNALDEKLSNDVLRENWDRVSLALLETGEMAIDNLNTERGRKDFEDILGEMVKEEYDIEVYADKWEYYGTFRDTGVEYTPVGEEWITANIVMVDYQPPDKIIFTISYEDAFRSIRDDYYVFEEDIPVPYTKKYAVFPFDYKEVVDALYEKVQRNYKDIIQMTPNGYKISDAERYVD